MKNLVFTSAGERKFRDKNNNPIERTPINEWTKGLKDFDLVTYCYDDSEIGKDKSNLWVQRKDTKFRNFYHYAHRYPAHLEQYDYVWIVDDDMFMSTDDINEMFYLMEEYNIDLGTPSFDVDGMHYVDILVNDPNYILRYSNYIECAAHIFSRDALKKVKHTFADTLSGNCWDNYISQMIHRRSKNNLAVFDKVKAYHGLSMSTINKVSARSNHPSEGKKFLKKYNADIDLGRDILGGIQLNGKEVKLNEYIPSVDSRIYIKVILGDTVTWHPSVKKYKR